MHRCTQFMDAGLGRANANISLVCFICFCHCLTIAKRIIFSLAPGDFRICGVAVVVMFDWHNGFYVGCILQGVLIRGADFPLYVALNRP